MIPLFADRADFEIRFQPFQLYPHLPSGNNEGVDKKEFFLSLHVSRGIDPAKSEDRFQWLTKAWKDDGLTLAPRNGKWGNSFDAQRLISWARKQGREDQMCEEIYTGNHVHNVALSEWSFLLAAAERAGVTGAEELLKSDQEAAEVKAKIQKYVDMGINAVPVIVINDQEPIMGAPDPELLAERFAMIVDEQLPMSASASAVAAGKL